MGAFKLMWKGKLSSKWKAERKVFRRGGETYPQKRKASKERKFVTGHKILSKG